MWCHLQAWRSDVATIRVSVLLIAIVGCIASLSVRPRIAVRVPGPIVYAVAKSPQAIPATLRATLQAHPGAGGILLRLLPGVYRLHEPVVLKAADCPLPVVIDGTGSTISGASIGPVITVTLSAEGFTAGMRPASEVFHSGKRVLGARWPRVGFAHVAKVVPGGFVADIPAPAAPGLAVHGYFGEPWSDDRLLVRAVAGRRVTVDRPGYGFAVGDRFFFERGATGPEVSVADSLLVLDHVSGLTVRGLAFEECRGDAIAINGGSHDVIDRCAIRNTGERAVVITGADHSGLIHCRVHDTGTGGVSIDAGDRQTLVPARCFVEDCRIHDYAVREWCYRPAVDLRGVGNRVLRCAIYNCPHEAIQFAGNDHLIEGNDIHNACLQTGDAGAIYTGRDWTMRGTIIRGNYIHDIPSSLGPGTEISCRGVYLDDLASGTTVTGNVFANVRPSVYVNGGRDNDVSGNVFYHARGVVSADRSPELTDEDKADMIRRLRAVPYQSPAYAKYGGLPHILDPSQHCWEPFNQVVPNQSTRSMPLVPPVGPRG